MKPFTAFLREAAAIKLSSSPFAATTDDYIKRLRQKYPAARDGMRIAGAYVSLTAFAGTVVINEISLPHSAQGKGTGHKAMKVLTDLADEMGVKLQLFAKPIDQGPDRDMISKSKLTAFYKKHGFVGAGRMIREPK